MKSLALVILTLTISSYAFAQVTYTKDQLNRMVDSGQFPEQSPVTTNSSRDMSFAGCKVAIEAIMSQIRAEYPVRTVVDTALMYTVKAWTNDGAITATCSEPDQKMVLTQAPYK